MKIGIVFHKNPFARPDSIDIVRLKAISKGLINNGIETEVLTPIEEEGLIDGFVPVRSISCLESGCFDLLKTCYHPSIDLINKYDIPVVSRIVRVVDNFLPERDESNRHNLLRYQAKIAEHAACVVVNNAENAVRWQSLYGTGLPVFLVPTGCPGVIPPVEKNPFDPGEKAILFLGSLAAPRMISLINEIALRFKAKARVHFIGTDKSHIYARGEGHTLSPLVVQHGPLPEEAIWNYVHHAHIGLAIATNPYPFDNDMSKILSYLRGGLQTLSEAPIVNNALVEETGLGLTFKYNDMEDLIKKTGYLLENRPSPEKRLEVMDFMAHTHSWGHRVETYVKLFECLIKTMPERHHCITASGRFAGQS